MARTADIIADLKRNWATPREALHDGLPSPFKLCCEFQGGASAEQVDALVDLPSELRDFWLASESAKLFKDSQYGQWGLRILSPDEVPNATNEYQHERQCDAVNGDLVIGSFYGDSDLVILRCDKACRDFGNVLISLPLDPRDGWDLVAHDFNGFLDQFVAAHGAKFWERR